MHGRPKREERGNGDERTVGLTERMGGSDEVHEIKMYRYVICGKEKVAGGGSWTGLRRLKAEIKGVFARRNEEGERHGAGSRGGTETRRGEGSEGKAGRADPSTSSSALLRTLRMTFCKRRTHRREWLRMTVFFERDLDTRKVTD